LFVDENTILESILYEMPEYAGAVPKQFRCLIRHGSGSLTGVDGDCADQGADFELEADGFEVVE
jgi:hypothetical protein